MREIVRKPSALFATLLVLFGSSSAFTADFDYPELSVTPRASERLEIEAKREADYRWGNFLPVEVGGAGNVIAAVLQFDANNIAPFIYGMTAGGLTLAGGLLLQATYTPYTSGLQKLESIPKGSSVREKLIRERMAEETINAAAATGQRIRWFGVIINGTAPLVMSILSSSNQNKTASAPKDYVAAGANIGALVLALTPIFFRPHWIDVAEQQTDYKKRIYAPVASGTLFQERSTGNLIPGLAVSFRF